MVGLYSNEINGSGGGGGGYSILRCVIISTDTSVNMRSIYIKMIKTTNELINTLKHIKLKDNTCTWKDELEKMKQTNKQQNKQTNHIDY